MYLISESIRAQRDALYLKVVTHIHELRFDVKQYNISDEGSITYLAKYLEMKGVHDINHILTSEVVASLLPALTMSKVALANFTDHIGHVEVFVVAYNHSPEMAAHYLFAVCTELPAGAQMYQYGQAVYVQCQHVLRERQITQLHQSATTLGAFNQYCSSSRQAMFARTQHPGIFRSQGMQMSGQFACVPVPVYKEQDRWFKPRYDNHPVAINNQVLITTSSDGHSSIIADNLATYIVNGWLVQFGMDNHDNRNDVEVITGNAPKAFDNVVMCGNAFRRMFVPSKRKENQQLLETLIR